MGAILSLASYARSQRVKNAAKNALHYLATRFTFQAMDGRRWTPTRRNCEIAPELNFYRSDGVAGMLGVLTGAHKWNDSPYGLRQELEDPGSCQTQDPSSSCYWPHYSQKEDGRPLIGARQQEMLLAALGEYEVPRAVHDFLLRNDAYYWARMTAQYDRRSYPIANLLPTKADYFDGDQATDSGINNERAPELYFQGPGFMNVAGGLFNPFYTYAEDSYIIPHEHAIACQKGPGDKVPIFASISKPYTVLPEIREVFDASGEFSHYLPEGFFGSYLQADAEEDLPLMVGDSDHFYKSANISTYKGFSYGYRMRRTGAALYAMLGTSSALFTPQDWDDCEEGSSPECACPSHGPSNDRVPRLELSIGVADFTVFDLRCFMESRGQEGHYFITADFHKKQSLFWSNRIARSLWEVVPADSFPSLQEVVNQLTVLNPPDHFQDGVTLAEKDYTYRMVSTGETLTLDQKYGAIFNGLVQLEEGRMQGISEIFNPVGLQHNNRDVYMAFNDNGFMNRMPLIDVKAVDAAGQYEAASGGGFRFYACAMDGWLCVNNPLDGTYLWADSRRGPGFDNPTYESGFFTAAGGEFGCSCPTVAGGGLWDPGPPDDGLPDDCSTGDCYPPPDDQGCSDLALACTVDSDCPHPDQTCQSIGDAGQSACLCPEPPPSCHDIYFVGCDVDTDCPDPTLQTCKFLRPDVPGSCICNNPSSCLDVPLDFGPMCATDGDCPNAGHRCEWSNCVCGM